MSPSIPPVNICCAHNTNLSNSIALMVKIISRFPNAFFLLHDTLYVRLYQILIGQGCPTNQCKCWYRTGGLDWLWDGHVLFSWLLYIYIFIWYGVSSFSGSIWFIFPPSHLRGFFRFLRSWIKGNEDFWFWLDGVF